MNRPSPVPSRSRRVLRWQLVFLCASLGVACVSGNEPAPPSAPSPSVNSGIAQTPAPFSSSSLTTSSWETDLHAPTSPVPESAASGHVTLPPVTTNAVPGALESVLPGTNLVAGTQPGSANHSPPPLTTNLLPSELDTTLPSANLITEAQRRASTNKLSHLQELQTLLELARQQHHERKNTQAATNLLTLLQTNAPPELQRSALFELALVYQDDGQHVRAQQVFAQYLRLHPQDPTTPEVLLRQGLLFRQMGANAAALRKFYAVITASLNLKLGELEYYQRLVLQAQTEIADTYFLEGNYTEAERFFELLLKLDSPKLNRPHIRYKLVRCLAALSKHPETAAQAQLFLDALPDATEAPEVRFLLANALKQQGRNAESLQQVLRLLESQQTNAVTHTDVWAYWQKRAGNEIANQLYKEGDFISTLTIFQSLAQVDPTPAWQLPVWYQIGLVYERLQQSARAAETYTRILDRQKELTNGVASPSLQAVIEMARWRKGNLAWFEQATASNLTLQREAKLDSTTATTP